MSRTGVSGVCVALVVLVFGCAAGASAQGELDYEDDRSTPEAVLGSLFNALDRHEFARAWSYWEVAPEQGFDAFQQGYAETASVQLSTGDTQSGVGAGQLYYATPAVLVATMNDASTQTFVGCYVLHLARPSFQTNPPYHPMGIQRATIQQVDNDADTAALMTQACPAM